MARDYSNLTPVIVPPSTTLEDLMTLARYNGWRGYKFDEKRGVLYAVTKDYTPPLVREETPMFLRRQAE